MRLTNLFIVILALIFILFDCLLFNSSAISPTIFPILIAAQLVFFVQQVKIAISKWDRIVLALILVAALTYLIFSKSRAAWMGFFAGLIVVAWLNRYFNRRRLFLLCARLVVAAFALSFFMKTGSSNGRLLIYKVITYNLSANDLVTGIGPGQFKVQYNLWQARYFEHHDINGREALLADNTFFAFNDYLQMVVERGVFGIIILFIAFMCFFLLLHKLKSMNKPSKLASGAAASIMVMATAALFSYPLQNRWIVAYVIACFAILLYAAITRVVLKYALVGLALLACLLFGWRGLYLQKQERLKNKAIALAETGHKRECLQLLQRMIVGGCTNGHVFYLYAKELYLTGQADSALVYLNRSTRYINTLESSRLFAEIYNEQGDIINAERYYLAAVYMVPNRFESRYDVLRFNLQQKDTLKAMYWAESILKLPVKVPSERVERIKAEAGKLFEL